MFREMIDITHEMDCGMPVFGAPWHIPFQIEQLGFIDQVGRETKKITMGTHCGTHIDAPLHFIKEGKSIENISLSALCGEVSIVDFSFLREKEALTVDMLQNYKPTSKMIFKFNWARYWKTDKFYTSYPYFSIEAARWLLEQKVEFIGMDTPSPDNPGVKLLSEEDSVIHKLWLSHGVILAEYLKLDEVISFEGWYIVALPLKIKNGDGAPARICLIRR